MWFILLLIVAPGAADSSVGENNQPNANGSHFGKNNMVLTTKNMDYLRKFAR